MYSKVGAVRNPNSWYKYSIPGGDNFEKMCMIDGEIIEA